MKRDAGLWIDHRKAVIVIVTDEGEETKLVESGKGELEKRLQGTELGRRVVGVETVDKMTDRQIAATVRRRFPG